MYNIDVGVRVPYLPTLNVAEADFFFLKFTVLLTKAVIFLFIICGF